MDKTTIKPQLKAMYIGMVSILVVLFCFLFFGKTIVVSALGITRLNNTSILISEISFWIILFLLSVYAKKIEQQNLLIWPERNYGFGMHIKSILAIFGAIIVISIPVTFVLNYLHLVKESNKITEMKTLLQANKQLLLFAAFTAGVTEEFIFRGYLMPRFEIVFKNPYIAISLSSILFGLLHFSYGTIFNMIGPMILGSVFGYFYWKYRNIAIPIICHFLWDYVLMSINVKPH